MKQGMFAEMGSKCMKSPEDANGRFRCNIPTFWDKELNCRSSGIYRSVLK